MSFLEINQLSFSYECKQPPVIDRLSFSVRQGEIIGILGASGSGKSTLLRLIAGLELPSEGEIRINGKAVFNGKKFIQPERRGVGMVFQDYALFPHLNVKKNIKFALHRLSNKEQNKQLKEMLELVQLDGFQDRYPYELSGGQQQRVALARALASKPDVLLMDEPFSNLDADLRSTIRSELRTILKSAQMTCLFVTHDRQDVDALSDSSFVME
jgi:iron(III) transport system ATP-binding protein